ncbi:MAG: hypothetical protein JSR18_10630 [Proteobacteria bacterium]|nr:hypothetical protein [Pseudomonadota bacterium]
MSHIAAATFEDRNAANEAVDALKRMGYDDADIDAFSVDARGRHVRARRPAPRGDEDPASVATDRAALRGAAIGSGLGALAGVLATPFIGPVAIAGGLAAGAYAGVLAGALNVLGDAPLVGRLRRRDGVVVAVRVEDRGDEHDVVAALDATGARRIERAEGTWRHGAWVDYDAAAAPAPDPLRAAA